MTFVSPQLPVRETSAPLNPLSAMMLSVLDVAEDAVIDSDVAARFLDANHDPRFRSRLGASFKLPSELRRRLIDDDAAPVRAAAAAATLRSVTVAADDEAFSGLSAMVADEEDLLVLSALLHEASAGLFETSTPLSAFAAACLDRLTVRAQSGDCSLEDLATPASVISWLKEDAMSIVADLGPLASAIWDVFRVGEYENVPWEVSRLWSLACAMDVTWLPGLPVAVDGVLGRAQMARLVAVAEGAPQLMPPEQRWPAMAVACDYLVLSPLAAAVADAGSIAAVPGVVVATLELHASTLLGALESPSCATGRALLDSLLRAFADVDAAELKHTVAVLTAAADGPSPDLTAAELAGYVSEACLDAQSALAVLRHPACSTDLAFSLFTMCSKGALEEAVDSFAVPAAAAAICWSAELWEHVAVSVRADVAACVLSSPTLFARLLEPDEQLSCEVAVSLAASLDDDMVGALPCSVSPQVLQLPRITAWVSSVLSVLSPQQLAMVSQFSLSGDAADLSFADLLVTVPSALEAPSLH